MLKVADEWGKLKVEKYQNGTYKTRTIQIDNSTNKYTLDQTVEIYEIVIELTDKYTFSELKKRLMEKALLR